MKDERKELAKRVKAVLRDFKKSFQPRGIQERMMLNLIWMNFEGGITDLVKEQPPDKTREIIRTVIGRLKWILETPKAEQ